VDWEGRPDDFVPTVSLISVDADFRKLLNLHLADGRWFLPDNQMDENNVVLNAAAVRLFQLREPVVGQKFEIHGREGQVIGVVRDFHFQNLRQKIGPLVLVVTPGSNSNVIVKVAAGRVAGVLAVAREVWATHCPELPFEYQFMDDAFNKMYETEQRHTGLFQLLSGLATLISCLGLFGLTVLSTAQRTKEIGIRKILGASVASVVGLVSKDFLKLVLLALLIASPVAWYFMEKWLQNYAYRIDITWWMFALAGAAAVAVAFATVSVQSIRAALTNPVDSLRNE
jgi:putative ABC transport system permease protein